MKVWVLFLDNVDDDNWVEIYSTKEKAQAALINYAERYKDEEDFYKSDDNDFVIWYTNYRSSSIDLFAQTVK